MEKVTPKDWNKFKRELAKNIEVTKGRGRSDKKTLDAMLTILEKSKLKSK